MSKLIDEAHIYSLFSQMHACGYHSHATTEAHATDCA